MFKLFLSDKKIYLIIGIGILLSMTVRTIYMSNHFKDDKLRWPDEKKYYKGAHAIGNLNSLCDFFTTPVHYKREPAYVIFLAGFLKVVPDHFLFVVRFSQSVIWCATAILIYFILLSISNSLTAMFGFFYVLFYPYYIYLGALLLPETIYTLLLAITVLLGIKTLKVKKKLLYYSFSALLAFAFITKATALLLIPLIPIVGFMIYGRNRALWQIPVVLFLFMIICSPFWYRNYKLEHRNMLLMRNDMAAMSENPYFTKTEKSIFTRTFSSLKMVPVNAKRFFTLRPGDIQSGNDNVPAYVKWISILCVIPVFTGLILGLFFIRQHHILFMYSFFVFYSIPYLIILGDTRYRLPVDFIGIVLFSMVINKICLKNFKIRNYEYSIDIDYK